MTKTLPLVAIVTLLIAGCGGGERSAETTTSTTVAVTTGPQPPIVVESPLPDDQVATPVRVRGTASVYEATLVVELVQDGKVVAKKTVTASTGAP